MSENLMEANSRFFNTTERNSFPSKNIYLIYKITSIDLIGTVVKGKGTIYSPVFLYA